MDYDNAYQVIERFWSNPDNFIHASPFLLYYTMRCGGDKIQGMKIAVNQAELESLSETELTQTLLFISSIDTSINPHEYLDENVIQNAYADLFSKDGSVKQFLTVCGSAAPFLTVCEQIAEFWGDTKCVLDMSAEEIEVAASKAVSLSYASLTTYLSLINNYFRWCKSNGYWSLSDYPVLSAKNVSLKDNVRENIPLSMDDFLDSVIGKDGAELPNTGRIALCLMWLGVDTSEMIKLKSADVDLNNRAIKKLGVDDIPRRMADFFLRYVNTDTLTAPSGRSGTTFLRADKTGLFLHRMLPEGSKYIGKPFVANDIKNAAARLPIRIGILQARCAGSLHRLHALGLAPDELSTEQISKVCRVNSEASISQWRRLYRDFCEILAEQNT